MEDLADGCIIPGNCPGAELLERTFVLNVRVLKNRSRGSNAKEISNETNHWIGCDLCFVAGSFGASAGAARAAETGTRTKASSLFWRKLERGRHRSSGSSRRSRRKIFFDKQLGVDVRRIFYGGAHGHDDFDGSVKSAGRDGI